MSYADASYYTDTYNGDAIPGAELNKFLERASESIDQLTSFRIQQNGGFDKLTVFQQTQVKKAVCCQADHLYNYGDMPSPNMTGYSINGNSVQFGSNVDLRYSRQAVDYIKPTNLLYRGL